MLSTRNFLFLSSLTAVASEFTDFKLVSSMDFSHPAFLEFVNLKNEPTDLSVTVFSASEPGEINLLKNITNVFSDPDYVSTLTTELISEGFEWPNQLSETPISVFSEDKLAKLCGNTDCTILDVGDGFLVPGHAKGTIYIQPVHVPGAEPIAPIKIAKEEDFWYYHHANWVDMDGDGLLDVIAGRAYTNLFGKTNGELVWFKQPASAEDVNDLWNMQILQEGPDVLLLLDTTVSGEVTVYAPEFWGEKLSRTVIKVAAVPKVVSYDVLDSELGAGYDALLADVTGDGVMELVVSNHEAKDGAIFAYDIADNTFTKHTVAQNFVVTKPGMNEAGPGFPYAFTPPNTSADRSWFLVAGDGTQGVHICIPKEGSSDPSAYDTEKIIEVGGTVGSLAMLDLKDGSLGVVVPDYDHSKLYFYRFFNN